MLQQWLFFELFIWYKNDDDDVCVNADSCKNVQIYVIGFMCHNSKEKKIEIKRYT